MNRARLTWIRFPNYYTIVGSGATWSSGTLLSSIETTIEYSQMHEEDAD
jgi:hypothetical protein